MPLTLEEAMDRAGSEKLRQRRPRAQVSGPAAHLPGVKNMQRSLQAIGMSVAITGTLDERTVAAINGIFAGWDDAPPALRGGDLTAAQIAAKLPAVQKYLKLAIGGAKEFGDATKEG